MRPNLLDRSGVAPDRPVNVQTMPAAPPAPPAPVREVIVGGGLKVRSGQPLRQTITTRNLNPHDAKVVLRGDWLAPDAPERARLDPLAAKLAAAWQALKSLDRELAEDRRSRALDPAGADRPRLDGDRLRESREEAIIRAEVALLHEADAVLGELRRRLPAEVADDDRHAAQLVARAERLRAEAEAAERDARQLVATTEWKRRTLTDGGLCRFADVLALAEPRPEPDGVLRLPRLGSGRVA